MLLWNCKPGKAAYDCEIIQMQNKAISSQIYN